MQDRFIDRLNKGNNRLDDKASRRLLEEFKRKFIIPDYDPKNQSRSWLFWCNWLYKPQTISTEEFEMIPLNKDTRVYFYSERHKEMYEVLFSEVCDFVAGLEPWEEIDAEIFDDSYSWVIAVTHEDISMFYGL